MSSLVAGICEEVGFRGYMQVPLERRFGPAAAIAGVSLIFVLIHLDRSWAVPVLPIIFLASVLLGVLAYKTKSLIPGIVGHTVLDVFDYSLWWTRLMGKFEYQTVFNSGIDAHFIIWVFIFLASLVIFIWTMLQLNTQSLAPATNDRNH
jgi:hypothetical protein